MTSRKNYTRPYFGAGFVGWFLGKLGYKTSPGTVEGASNANYNATFGARSGTSRVSYLDYYLAPSTLTNQTYVSPQSSSAYLVPAVYGYAISPASNGNMFLAMGF